VKRERERFPLHKIRPESEQREVTGCRLKGDRPSGSNDKSAREAISFGPSADEPRTFDPDALGDWSAGAD
jgi:hypothetical protein